MAGRQWIGHGAVVLGTIIVMVVGTKVDAQAPSISPAPPQAVAEAPPVRLGERFTLPSATADRGGGRDRLLCVRLVEPLPPGSLVRVFSVSDEGGREKLQPLPSQWEQAVADSAPRVWWIAPASPKTPGNGERFRVERIEPSAAANDRVPLTIERTSDALLVRRGEMRILRYNMSHVEPPPGVDAKYGRSAFIHPAWTPAGAVATDQFPPDHLHQSGIFLAYTKTVFEGREPNFWDLLGGKGRVRFEALKGIVAGPVFAEFQVAHLHVDLSGPMEKPALRETWAVRVWNIGGPEDRFWVWDLTSTARCASASPLKLPQYHYGGMAVRGGRGWTANAVRFLTSEGLERANGNHSRPRWCDMSGPVEPASRADSNESVPGPQATGVSFAGVALLTHPGNFRFPEPLRIHPSMPYMVYTPSQLGEWSIEPEQTRTSRYRWLVHDGDLPPEAIERVWQAFAR